MTTTITASEATWKPVCVGTTEHTLLSAASDPPSAADLAYLSSQQRPEPHSQAFRGAQFTGDGTTIVTQHDDQCLRTFVLPIGLLDEETRPHNLKDHCTLPSSTSIRSYALHPHFDLQNSSTAVLACASKDLPIHLVNGLHPHVLHASYPLVDPTTEAYIAPHSLAWTSDGSRLIAGSKNLISVFDASYDGQGPLLKHKTAPGRLERKVYGRSNLNGCSGIISALSISHDGFLAAGTTQREIALYAHSGNGECVTSFSVAALPGEQNPTKGDGIMQLAWSPCGTYLHVAERQSDSIQVYDVRKTLNRVSWLAGRNAQTTQRLAIDVIPTTAGCEVWGGGTDGQVRMWKDPGKVEGEHEPESALDLHTGPVSSTIWHPRGAVLATCANASSRDCEKDTDLGMGSSFGDTKTPGSPDSTLRVWTL